MFVPLTPLEFCRRARRLYPQREAVVDGDVRLTYEQFFRRCDLWSAALQRLGVRKGDRVAFISPNTHVSLELFCALPQIGAVLVPINYRLVADDFAYIIGHSGATVVCVHSDHLEAVDGVRGLLPVVEHFVALEGSREGWLDDETLLDSATEGYERLEIAEGDLISINYTSGTTARPKGVMITHRNAYMNVVGTLIHLHMTPADRHLWTVPMFHANGWRFVWIVTAVGATHVCLRRPEPRSVFDLVARERVTVLGAVPTVLVGLANAPDEVRRTARPGVRVLTAGAPPAAATIERVEDALGWEITQLYGLTETAQFSICEPRPEHADLPLDERAAIKGRQGVEMITSGEMRVVDPGGHEVPHDGRTPGEIVLRGNVVMEGYYDEPEATASAIRDGWLHTGDAAVVHPDGYVEIRDRIKDVIISGGENISSVEVESCLYGHPDVYECAVVAVPDEKWGEAPRAVVVLKPGGAATESELIDHCRARMAHYKVPRSVEFRVALPKGGTGKILKREIREPYWRDQPARVH